MCIVRHGYTPRDLTNDHYQTHGQHIAEKSLSDKWPILTIQHSINRDFTFLSKILFLMPTTPSHSCLTKFFRVHYLPLVFLPKCVLILSDVYWLINNQQPLILCKLWAHRTIFIQGLSSIQKILSILFLELIEIGSGIFCIE